MPQRSPAAPLLAGLTLGLRIGASVAIPLLLSVLLGRSLDRLFQTSPLFVLLGILLSALVTLVLIVREVRHVIGST